MAGVAVIPGLTAQRCRLDRTASQVAAGSGDKFWFARFKIGHTPRKFPDSLGRPPPASTHINAIFTAYLGIITQTKQKIKSFFTIFLKNFC